MSRAEPPVCDRHGRPVVMIHQFDYSDGVMTPLDRFSCAVCGDATRGPDWKFDDAECPLPPELSDDLDGFMSGMGGVFS